MTDQLPSKNLVSRLRAVSRSASKWAIVSKQVEDPEYKTIYELITKVADESADEIERLRTALTGISTCSTCEACRGAARLALGGVAPAAEPKLISTVEMLREVEDTLIDLGWHKDRGVLKRVTDCMDEVGRTLPPGDSHGS